MERGILRTFKVDGTPVEIGDEYLRSLCFGIDQTWYNETANREQGIWYTNTTNRLIIVNIRRGYSGLAEGAVSLNLLSPDGTTFNNMEQFVFGTTSGVSQVNNMYAFVPPRWSYIWSRNSGNTVSTPSSWYEYK